MNVKKLAEEMQVTEKDVLSLVKMVADKLEEEKVKDGFLNMSQADQVEFAKAYASAEIKKFCEFCVSLLTNEEKKNAFDNCLSKKLGELDK